MIEFIIGEVIRKMNGNGRRGDGSDVIGDTWYIPMDEVMSRNVL